MGADRRALHAGEAPGGIAIVGNAAALSTEASPRASNVKAIHVHPAFNSGNSLEHDVALIQLNAPWTVHSRWRCGPTPVISSRAANSP